MIETGVFDHPNMRDALNQRHTINEAKSEENESDFAIRRPREPERESKLW